PERHYGWPALVAAALASIIETGKLFIPAQHPDPTNILIAAAAAMLASWLLYLLLDVRQVRSEADAQPASALRPADPHVPPVPPVTRIQPASLAPPVLSVPPLPSAADGGLHSIFSG